MSDKEQPENEEQFVKLVSAEGLEFFVKRDIAIASSQTIRLMLEGSFREAQDNVINFPEISSYIMEKVVHYLHYKSIYSNSDARIPEFPIEPELSLELLIAARYLGC